eukprot:s8593_g1.t2
MESGERLETVLNGVLFAKLLDEVWLAAHWERKLKKQDRDAGTQGPSRQAGSSQRTQHFSPQLPTMSEFTIRTRKFQTNPLLARKQFVLDVIHPSMANVAKKDLTEKLAKMYKVKDTACIQLFSFKTAFGGGRSTGFGLIYESLDKMKKFEPKYRLKRAGVGGEKTGAGRRGKKDTKNRMKKARGKDKSKARTLHEFLYCCAQTATGHLLVGACKIYCKQSAFLEEEADEVRAGLMMAFSRPTEEPEVEISGRIREVRPGALTPILADDQAEDTKQSSLSSLDLEGPAGRQEAHRALGGRTVPMGTTWQQKLWRSRREELESAATGEHHDFDTLPLVALSDQPKAAAEPEEPAEGWLCASLRLRCLAQLIEDVTPASRNASTDVAKYELENLKTGRKVYVKKGMLFFLSSKEAALEKISKDCWMWKQRECTEQFPTEDTIAMKKEHASPPSRNGVGDLGLDSEDVMPLDMELALEDEAPAAPAAAETSTSPVPYAQEKVIDMEDLNQVAGQAAVQLVPLSNLAVERASAREMAGCAAISPQVSQARQLIMLGEEDQQAVLGFFQAQRREEIQTLLDQAPDSLAVAGDPGDAGYGGYAGDAMPVSHAYFEGTLAPFERPADGDGSVRKKRRTQFVADEMPEIPKETYRGYMNDRDKITRKGDLDYHLMLPHYSPHLPNFTTTFTDMCKTLCEGILWGSEVAEKRRRLTKDAEPDRVFEAAGVFAGAGGAGPSEPAGPEEVSILTEEQRNNLSLYVKQKTADKPNSLAPLLGPVLSPDKAGLRSGAWPAGLPPGQVIRMDLLAQYSDSEGEDRQPKRRPRPLACCQPERLRRQSRVSPSLVLILHCCRPSVDAAPDVDTLALGAVTEWAYNTVDKRILTNPTIAALSKPLQGPLEEGRPGVRSSRERDALAHLEV